MSKNFHSLKIREIRPETTDAKTVVFEIPADLKSEFEFTQGQYLTLKFNINGKEVRRAYSMCSSPVEENIAVTVKRVKKGLVSNHINNNLREGDTVEVMTPDGRFFTELHHNNSKTYYLFGAGSGITPLMSILKTVLEKEPKSTIHLLYGNRNEDCIIFKNELDALEKKYAGQLTVTHILSQPKKEKSKGFGSFLKKGKITWAGKVGRINTNVAGSFLEEYPNRNANAEYFVCGPGNMPEIVEDYLKAKNIDTKNIHKEVFVNATEAAANKAAAAAEGTGAKMLCTLDGTKVTINIPPGKTILDTLLNAGHDAPYSCTAGACATCMAKVTKGSTKMEQCYALDDSEIEKGYILTCQAHPTSEEIEVTYDI